MDLQTLEIRGNGHGEKRSMINCGSMNNSLDMMQMCCCDLFEDRKKMKGEGFWKRDPYKFPPKTRKLLEKKGGEKLGTITIYKYLLPDVSKLTKIFSKSGKVPYDDIYHLGMAFNNLRYDKDAVITLEEVNGIPSGKPKLETMKVPIPFETTINDFIAMHQKKMGQQRYWQYKALSWNCQDFTKNAMQALGVWDSEMEKFVMQDPKLIKGDLPSFASGAANFLNELKLLLNRRIEGEGKEIKFKGSGGDIKLDEKGFPEGISGSGSFISRMRNNRVRPASAAELRRIELEREAEEREEREREYERETDRDFGRSNNRLRGTVVLGPGDYITPADVKRRGFEKERERMLKEEEEDYLKRTKIREGIETKIAW